MRIVVDKRRTAIHSAMVETAHDASKSAEGIATIVESNLELHRHRNRGECIQNIVLPPQR